jgi:L-fuconate dehydratase
MVDFLAQLANISITSVRLRDVRFPTSLTKEGSDARSQDPDYSLVYCELSASNTSHVGVGMAFSLGRGNELLRQAANLLQRSLIDLPLSDCYSDFAKVWRKVVGSRDGQLLWVGPDKAVVHQAGAMLVNALWDLWAKVAGLPLWQLVCSLPDDVLARAVPLWDVEDELTYDDLLAILRSEPPNSPSSTRAERIMQTQALGVPAYTTATGWSGYSDEKVLGLLDAALAQGFRSYKMKVGLGLDRDCERAALIKSRIGQDNVLMMDANSVWTVDEAIASMRVLAKFQPRWIEEPIHCDDILGHLKVQKALDEFGIKVAGGEQTANRVLMKQFLSSGAYTICQQDAVKTAGLNEWLTAVFLAAKYNAPVCPHTGGVGLCQMGPHLGAIDLCAVGKEREGRETEYMCSLEEHFLYPPIIENGNYKAPTSLGWGLDMHEASLEKYEWPIGAYWADKLDHFDKAGMVPDIER